MLHCYTKDEKDCTPIFLITEADFADWKKKQTKFVANILTHFKTDIGSFIFIPDANGKTERVLTIVSDEPHFFDLGHLPLSLPEGKYIIENDSPGSAYAIAWGLGAYQFTKYKKPTRNPAILCLENDATTTQSMVEAIYLTRDLVNTPTEDLGPSELSKVMADLAKKYDAKFHEIVGDDLLAGGFNAIHAVGRASDDEPRLLDLRWGDKKHPKITLVGKGVCFDSGGLDLKASAYMLLMKKDMGGAANILGLAKMIMAAKLAVNLRVLIPAVENVVSGNAYKPGDVITSKKGLTIEINNTDAEGRLVLADALTEAASDNPEFIIDMATLTGAARVALGTDLPALFCNNKELSQALTQHGETQHDPLWPMPLFDGYKSAIKSPIADLNNSPMDSYGGAITAALFLQEFVPSDTPWVHIDFISYNLHSRPGRPQGGEAMAIRAIFSYLCDKY